MTQPERDAELEAWLGRSSSLHDQLARLDRSEPPEELDRIVLDRAREAIRAPRSVAPLRQLRWAASVALAATLVLSFVVFLHVGPAPVDTNPAPATARQERLEADSESRAAYDSPREDSAPQPYVVPQPLELPPPDVAASEPVARMQSAPARALVARESIGTEQARTSPDVRADADAWLAEIKRLRAQGLLAEADREWAEFQRMYPDRSAMPAGAAAPEER